MAKLKKLEGIIPSACVVYTDETCRTIDEDACRQHLRYLLGYDIGALVVGGHAGEVECLTREERKRRIRIAQEEAKGKVPVAGGVCCDSTREAIEQGWDAKEAGADAVLFTPPTIIGWDRETAGNLLVEHFRRFDKEVDIPIILFGAPTVVSGGSYNILPRTFQEIARCIENVVACKIPVRWDHNPLPAVIRAFKEVRDIGCLYAGSAHLFGGLLCGADGNLSGSSNWRVEEDVQIYKLVKKGDFAKAKEISDRITPVSNVEYGREVGLSATYFHYRYKLCAWLLGLIPRPHMRLPQMPPTVEDIEMLRQALIKAGKPVVREAQEFAVAST